MFVNFFMHWLIMWIYAIVIFAILGACGVCFFYQGGLQIADIRTEKLAAHRQGVLNAGNDISSMMNTPTLDYE